MLHISLKFFITCISEIVVIMVNVSFKYNHFVPSIRTQVYIPLKVYSQLAQGIPDPGSNPMS